MGPPPTWRGQFGATWWLDDQAMWPASRVEQPPLTRASPPRVDAWQPRLEPNRLKPWPASQGVGSTGRLMEPLSLGSGPLGPRVKYNPVVMMILTFCQLHFVIPQNAPIWYLSS
jgi:hypothetical protein